MIVIIAMVLGAIAVIFLLVVLYFKLDSVSEYTSEARMDAKTVIITGATSGIGKMAAFDLAGRGARVILACRNLNKANVVADEIRTTTSNNNIVVHYLDTSKLSSVRDFAKVIIDTEERINVLILNAGTGGSNDFQQTEDKIEMSMATNYFGHFLLTNLLLEIIIKSAPSRIICVSSTLHILVRSINVEKLNIKKENFFYSNPYGLSKTCLIMFARYLGQLLQGHNVTVNSMCPGMVKTELFSKTDSWFTSRLIGFFARFLSRTVAEGTSPLLYLAVDDEVKCTTGKYFKAYMLTRESSLVKDENVIKQVWEKSEEIVGLTEQEASLLKRLKTEQAE